MSSSSAVGHCIVDGDPNVMSIAVRCGKLEDRNLQSVLGLMSLLYIQFGKVVMRLNVSINSSSWNDFLARIVDSWGWREETNGL